jgi:putative glutamine amidotransferase
MRKPLIGIGTDIFIEAGHRDRAFVYMTYVDSLRRAGAIPVLIPPQPENAAALVAELDGIVLAGGFDCDPSVYGEEPHPTVEPMDERRQQNDMSLAKLARERNLPTLGICLGMQMMNVAAGGSLVQDINSEIETEILHESSPSARLRHDVTVEPGTKLAKVIAARDLNVNSSHHQSVKNVGRGLNVTAKAPDGVIEGLEDPNHPFYVGVQWHPEDMPGEASASAIFGAFVEAARRYAAGKESSRELSPAGVTRSE